MMEFGFVLLLVGGALLPDSSARRSATLAALSAGLAIAGLRAGQAPAFTPGAAAPAGLPAGFVAVDGALVLMAVVLAAGSALAAARAARAAETRIAAGTLAAGAVALASGGADLLTGARAMGLLVSLCALAGTGGLLLLAGRYVRLRPAAGMDATTVRPAAIGGVAAGGLATAAGPHLAVVLMGVMVATWSAYALRRLGRPPVPLAPLLTLGLVPAWWLLATIAGPDGLHMGALSAIPASPAAERLLAIPLLLAGWALAGLWPLQRQVPGELVAGIGVLLMVRVAIPVVPDGLEHWRPLAMPLIVAGTWHAALSGRRLLVAVGVAWVGLLAPGRDGTVAAALLLATALLAVLLSWRAIGSPLLARVAAAVTALGFGSGALLAIESGLHAEVVYTVLAAGAVVAAAGAPADLQAITARASRTTEPSA